jgi:hypothetical protein
MVGVAKDLAVTGARGISGIILSMPWKIHFHGENVGLELERRMT